MTNELPLHVQAHPSLYATLTRYAGEREPISYLEIGVREGDSLRRVIEAAGPALRELALCDDWSGESGGSNRGGHAHIQALLEDLHYAGEVQWLDGNSHELLRPVLGGRQFDLILIDGDHTAAGAAQDLEDCAGLLAPEGRLIFDDIGHPDHPYLADALQTFVTVHPKLEVVEIPRDSFCGVAVLRRRPA
jgi:hypothetical protein